MLAVAPGPCVQRALCSPTGAANLRFSLHPQLLCWYPLNFKSSSKFPRPSATLSNITPTCIYPYISQLIGSAAQLQALGEYFLNRFGGLPCQHPSPSPPSTTLVMADFSSQSFIPGLLGERVSLSCSPLPLMTWGSSHAVLRTWRNRPFLCQRALHIIFTALCLDTIQLKVILEREYRLGNQTELGLNSSSAISSEALDKLFNLPEPVQNGYNLITSRVS